MVFTVVRYRCESWTIKKAEYQRNDIFKLVLEKTLESLLDSKDIKTVNPKGNQPWIFIERTGVEAKAPILWPPPMGRANSLEKTLMLGKTEGRRRREGTEDEMVGWHHWLRGHKFEQTLGDSEGQGSLANSSPWDHRERSNLATEQQDILQTLKWSKVKWSCSVMSDFLRPHGL